MHCTDNPKTVEVVFGLCVNVNGKLLVIKRRRKEMENEAWELEGEEVGREMVEAKHRVRNIYVHIYLMGEKVIWHECVAVFSRAAGE